MYLTGPRKLIMVEEEPRPLSDHLAVVVDLADSGAADR